MAKRPLGELLIEHGVITQDELVLALAEQQRTRRPLGEVVVTLGLAPGPIVAQALATQYGGTVKTEYGFATGWAEDAAATITRLRARVAELEAALADPWASTTTHLCLVQDGERYELSECEGPPPAVGSIVDGRRVSRVAPCVYLLD